MGTNRLGRGDGLCVTDQAGIGNIAFRLTTDAFYCIAMICRHIKPLKCCLQYIKPASGCLRSETQFTSDLTVIDFLGGQCGHKTHKTANVKLGKFN